MRAVGPVIADVAVVGDLVEVVPFLVQLEVENQAAGGRDQLALVLDADLPFGKYLELAFELLLRPGSMPGKQRFCRATTPSQSVGRSGRTTRFFSNVLRLIFVMQDRKALKLKPDK